MSRSEQRIVANPLLALDGVKALRALDPTVRATIASALKEVQLDARERADKAWRTHKAPMAVYWKAVGVYAGHLSRVLRS